MLAAASSQATVAKGECPAPLNNRNQWLREGKPRQKNPGPPGWGLGVGLITPPRKKSLITETEISKNTGYNGCSTTTCRTPDDAFITWIDGAMTTMSEETVNVLKERLTKYLENKRQALQWKGYKAPQYLY